MNKHSPGPWEARGIPWRPLDEGARYHREVVDAKGLRVGEVWVGDDDHPDSEEGLANLCLILKAPELMAAVQEILNGHCLDDASGECLLEQDPVLVDAQALLKEIDGKEEAYAPNNSYARWRRPGRPTHS